MAKMFSSDTILAALGTMAAVLAVVINQQWLSEKRDTISVLLDEQRGNRHHMVRVEDTKRESIRLRDLNTLYTVLNDLAGRDDTDNMILEEAIRAYEIAIFSMLAFEPAETFDAATFHIESIATRARAGDMNAWRQMGDEFVRLYGIVDRRLGVLRKRQDEIRMGISALRSEISEISQLATYLQVFGLILVMIATIVGLKRIEAHWR